MKKTKQRIYWAGLLAAALILPAFAADGADNAKPAADNENRYEAAANRLNLSAEQKEKMKALRQNQKQQMTELQQAVKEKRRQLKDELNNPGATRENLAPLVNELKDIHAKMIDQRIEMIFAVKSILTPEQLTKLQEIRQTTSKDERGCRPFWLEKRRANKEKRNQEE